MEGQVALITGGTRGIGKGIADALLEHKVKVCISGRDADVGKATSDELRAKHTEAQVIFYQCDVINKDQLENLFKHTLATFGRLDIVVNNAGKIFEKEWTSVVETNLTAVMNATNLAIDYMGTHRGGKGGHVINMSSIVGLVPSPLFPHYVATKFALVGYTISISEVSQKEYGIRTNVVCPSYVNTEFINWTEEDKTNGRFFGSGDIDGRCAKNLVSHGSGKVPVDEVIRSVMVLIKDQSLNGRAMVVCPLGSGLVVGAPETAQELLDLFVPEKI